MKNSMVAPQKLKKNYHMIQLFYFWVFMQRKGNPFTLLVGMQTSTATMENSVGIP